MYFWEATVQDRRDTSVHVHDGVNEDPFVRMRTEWDATLSAPGDAYTVDPGQHPRLQIPPVKASGVSFLKIPVKPKAGD